MQNLFTGMEQTAEAVPPYALLTQLRVLAPQFAELDERSGGFAQQGWSSSPMCLIHRCRRSVDTDRLGIARYFAILHWPVFHRRVHVY
jgi:ubiquitin carboxyl-terminal hydrolase 14